MTNSWCRPATVVVNKVDKKGVVWWSPRTTGSGGRNRRNWRKTSVWESEDISNPYVIQWCQLNISWVSFGVWGCDLYRSRSTCWVKEADDAVRTLRRDRDFCGIPKTGHESSYKFSWVLLRIKDSSSLPPCPLNVIKNDRTALSFWTKTSKAKSTVGRCIPEETKPTWVAMKALSWCCECQRLPFNSSGGLANMSPRGFSY